MVATGQLGTAHQDVPDPPVPEDIALVIDDAHGTAGHRPPDIHQLDRAHARFGVHGHAIAQRRPVQDQRLGHFPGRREGHRERRLGQAVDGLGRRRIQPRRPRLDGEGTPYSGCDRLRPDQEQPYGREVQPGQDVVGNAAYGQRQGEVGRGQHRRPVPVRRLEPQAGPLGEGQRADLDLPGPGGQRREMRTDEPHVVEVRHPADHHVVGAQRRGGPYLLQIGQHRTVRHLHALGRTRASRGELQERHVVATAGCGFAQRRRLAQGIEGQGACTLGQLIDQRRGRGVHDDGRPPQVLPDRQDPTGIGGQRNGHETGRHRAPEHRLEVLAAIGEQRHTGPGRDARLPETTGHPQGIVQKLAQGDRQLASVATDMHDDLPGGFTDRVQQYIQQRHVVLHRSIRPFRASSPENDLKNARDGGNQPPGGDRVHPGTDRVKESGPGPGGRESDLPGRSWTGRAGSHTGAGSPTLRSARPAARPRRTTPWNRSPPAWGARRPRRRRPGGPPSSAPPSTPGRRPRHASACRRGSCPCPRRAGAARTIRIRRSSPRHGRGTRSASPASRAVPGGRSAH
ncbi:hypothetical protein P376_0652 [Streptomyces sp. HCCB10043]|nr:hypothetical protein P376_0652 [Streptomyces sp. HCCB10043]